ncbi:hypothetical protein U1Q18_009045 [Sarracenia purpurea var. burkii]
MEGDSLTVINAIKSDGDDRSYIGGVMEAAKAELALFSRLVCSHIRRKGNSIAHELARLATSINEARVWYGDIHSPLRPQWCCAVFAVVSLRSLRRRWKGGEQLLFGAVHRSVRWDGYALLAMRVKDDVSKMFTDFSGIMLVNSLADSFWDRCRMIAMTMRGSQVKDPVLLDQESILGGCSFGLSSVGLVSSMVCLVCFDFVCFFWVGFRVWVGLFGWVSWVGYVGCVELFSGWFLLSGLDCYCGWVCAEGSTKVSSKGWFCCLRAVVSLSVFWGCFLGLLSFVLRVSGVSLSSRGFAECCFCSHGDKGCGYFSDLGCFLAVSPSWEVVFLGCPLWVWVLPWFVWFVLSSYVFSGWFFGSGWVRLAGSLGWVLSVALCCLLDVSFCRAWVVFAAGSVQRALPRFLLWAGFAVFVLLFLSIFLGLFLEFCSLCCEFLVCLV